MSITYKKGCLLQALKSGEVDYILHQTNNFGVMGSGIAKQIKEQFPEAYEAYRIEYKRYTDGTYKLPMLGSVSGASNVINMTAQDSYGYNGKRYTNYGALANCLTEVFYYVQEDEFRIKNMHNLKEKIKIGIPYKMSSDRGGADWQIVLELVEYLLATWADVYIYRLGDL